MAIRNLLTRGIGFAPAGVNFLVTHGFSSGVAVVAVVQQGGGAVVVELPGKRKKRKPKGKSFSEEIQSVIEEPRVISEVEAGGMAAIYGSQMRGEIADNVEPESILGNVLESETPLLKPFNFPDPVFSRYEVEPDQIEEIAPETDDIALILAIIEAIG